MDAKAFDTQAPYAQARGARDSPYASRVPHEARTLRARSRCVPARALAGAGSRERGVFCGNSRQRTRLPARRAVPEAALAGRHCARRSIALWRALRHSVARCARPGRRSQRRSTSSRRCCVARRRARARARDVETASRGRGTRLNRCTPAQGRALADPREVARVRARLGRG